jgi:hypothetical protein
VRSQHVVMLALALATSACSDSNESAVPDSTLAAPTVVATTVTTTPATTTSAAPSTTEESTTTTSVAPVVDTANDNVIDDTEWVELSAILQADPDASFLFDTVTKSLVEDAGQTGCISVQARLTLSDLLLAIQSQGNDERFNNAVFAEIKAAMPYICADSFATAGA